MSGSGYADYSEFANLTKTESRKIYTNLGLGEIRNEEIKEIYKLKFIIEILQKIAIQKSNLDSNTLKKSLKLLLIQNYLKVDEKINILGIDSENLNLGFTERNAVREKIVNQIMTCSQPIVEYSENLKQRRPEIFNLKQNELGIIALEEKRQKLQIQLIELKNKKCSYLKHCTEMKIGPHFKNELEIILSKYKISQLKAEVLQKFIVQELTSSTELTEIAIKEVSKHIDDELDKCKEDFTVHNQN